MKICWPIFFLLSIGTFHVYGQKIKYKDLFPDLEARKFNKVEPQLRTFLSDEKNANHANGNYQMGLIVEAKFSLQDIVEDTAQLFAFGNEAIGYFQTSRDNITEKELKKNEKYYQAFFRRDLRTGEFGIKVSDVHLDIEEKIAGIQERMTAVKDFHKAVNDLTSIEEQMLGVFNGFVASANSEESFLMQSDLDIISTIGDLQAMAKSFNDRASKAIEVQELLGVTDYYKSIEYQPINGFDKLEAIFPKDNLIIKTWDFTQWASQTKSTLNSVIFMLKDDLLAFDQEMKRVMGTILNGSPDRLTQWDRTLMAGLNKYDPNGPAQNIITAKWHYNNALILSDTTFNKSLFDSLSVSVQLETSDSVVNSLKSIQTLLASTTISDQRLDRYYSQYVQDAFGGTDALSKYAQETNAWASQMLLAWDTIQAYWELRNNWGLTTTDTIPLRRVEEGFSGTYITNGSLEFPGDSVIVWGVKSDSLLGFVAKFGPDRQVVWEKRFESDLFKNDKGLYMSDTLASIENEIALYLYDESSGEEGDIAFLNFSSDGRINWNVDAAVGKEPEYSVFAPTVHEITIFLHPQEAYPLPSGELGYIVINRKGEVR